MKQIWTLTRMQLGSALEFLNIRRNKDRKKNLSAAAIVFFGVLLFMFISGMYGFSMGMAMQQMGELDVLPGFFVAAACLLMFITSVLKVKGILFGFKDYDIVMSLPVKSSIVVASRLMLLYIINLMFSVGLLLPIIAVYGYLAHPQPLFYVLSIVSLFIIPLIPMIAASVLGVLLSMVSSRFKHSNVVGMIVMFVFYLAIFFGMLFIQNESQLVEMGSIFRDKMLTMYPLAGWYLEGVIDFNIGKYALFTGVSILCYVVFSMAVGKIFKPLNDMISSIHVNAKFKMKELKQNSVLKALYQKEAKRYFGCTIYVFNTGFGLVILLIGAIAIHFIKNDQMTMVLTTPEIVDLLKKLAPFAISMMIGMTAITASSISLEGKNFWILKAAPVDGNTILNAKLLFSLSLMMPVCIVSAISFSILLKLDLISVIIMIAMPLAYSYFVSVLGLEINLKYPLMEWKNETVVVKQSTATMIATLAGMAVVGIPIGLSFVISLDTTWYHIICTAVVGLAAFLMHQHLNRKGQQLIAQI